MEKFLFCLKDVEEDPSHQKITSKIVWQLVTFQLKIYSKNIKKNFTSCHFKTMNRFHWQNVKWNDFVLFIIKHQCSRFQGKNLKGNWWKLKSLYSVFTQESEKITVAERESKINERLKIFIDQYFFHSNFSYFLWNIIWPSVYRES